MVRCKWHASTYIRNPYPVLRQKQMTKVLDVLQTTYAHNYIAGLNGPGTMNIQSGATTVAQKKKKKTTNDTFVYNSATARLYHYYINSYS